VRELVDLRCAEEAEYVSTHLLAYAALLTRLLSREVLDTEVSRTEAGVLRALSDGPLRIGELAESEGLAQPTTTLLVKRMEEEGLVRRERQSEDQRVVLVSLTDAGAAALEQFRAQAREALRTYLQEMSDAQVQGLASATGALHELIVALTDGAPGRGADR